MKDRLDDVLQSRSLSDNLIAPCHLSTQSLRRLIRNPDFRQEAAGIEPRQNAGIDRVRLDLGIGDDAHLLGVAITTFFTCGATTAAAEDALPVASITTTSSNDSFAAKASSRSRRMSTRPNRLSPPSPKLPPRRRHDGYPVQ